MADLTFSLQEIPSMPGSAVIKIGGAIDAKTVVVFQEKLDALQEQSYKGFILDMEGIRYVNSTGLGTLVNVADALESHGGAMALVKIHPKVKVVFDMLGLNAFFKIFSVESEALEHLKKMLNKEKRDEVPPPTTEKPDEPQSDRVKEKKPPEAPHQPITTVAGPAGFTCQTCNVKLNIPKPGSYKCPRCGTFFKLMENRSIIWADTKKSAPWEFKLSCCEECAEGLAEFIGVIANRIGFSSDEVQSIKASILEICAAVMERAYENKLYMTFNVVLNISSTEIKIQFSDFGKFIYDDAVAFAHSKKVMQEFSHKEHPKGGNVIQVMRRLAVSRDQSR